MHITILALGSRGDIQPYTALGLGLKAAGHQVRIATHRPYKDFVRTNKLEYAPMSGNPQELVRTEQSKLWLESGRNPFLFIRRFVGLSRGFFDDLLHDSWEVCQGTDAILFSTLGVSGYHIAKRLGLPSIYAPLQPFTRTRYVPSFFIPSNIRLPKVLNWFSHLFIEQLTWQPFRQTFNRWRCDQLGLDPLPFWGPYARLYRDCLPMLYGFSPLIVPEEPDWPVCHHATGYWILSNQKGWEPSPELVAFLDNGPKPIYIGFGSMTHREPERIREGIEKSLDISGQRAVVVRGWGDLQPRNANDRVFLLDGAPHEWLFPKMAAVVHHGGAGTTAAGLRAGAPAIIVPFFGDQPFWGSRVKSLGVGTQPIPIQKLTGPRLAGAITAAISTQGMQIRAEALGKQLRAEDGVTSAVDLVRQYLS
jgi:UDP:flavonoid glycosyltransferase YjiC (YdhE family)